MVKRQVVFMYSGQGSQYYQMGRQLYDENPRFRSWMNYCDEIVSYKIDLSLTEFIYGDKKKSEPFDDVLLSSVALICFEYSLSRTLMDLGIYPDVLLGYSLGEVSAAVVSGALSVEDGIDIAICFADSVNNIETPASMIAVVAPHTIFENMAKGIECCWMTAINFDNHFVVTGESESIQVFKKRLDESGIVNQILPVNYGFHTPMLEETKAYIQSSIKYLDLNELSIPIISCLRMEEVKEFDELFFWELVRNPVYFEKTIGNMLASNDYLFMDVGPSGTLSTFVKYLLPKNTSSAQMELINQFGQDVANLQKVSNFFSKPADNINTFSH